MLNVYELETKWKIYKIKSYIPYFVIFTSSMIILALSYFFLFSNEEQKTEQTTQFINLEQVPKEVVTPITTNNSKEDNTPVITTEVQAVQQQAVITPRAQLQTNDKVILAPSLSFMKTMDRDSLPSYNETPLIEEDNQENSSNETLTSNKQSQASIAQDEVIVEQQNPQVSSTISIQRKDTLSDLQQVVKRFEKNENPALSLFIAKKYYELGDYHKAYSYALRTNDLNSNIEESWIIFSKSLVKLNEKEMAIQTLKQYIQHSNSNQAKVLLDEINSGKFK